MRLTERQAAIRAAPPSHGRTWACRLRWHRACVVHRYRFVGGLAPCHCRCHTAPVAVLAAPLGPLATP